MPLLLHLREKNQGKQSAEPTGLHKHARDEFSYLAELSPDLPTASSLVSGGFCVLNFKVLQKKKIKSGGNIGSACVNIYSGRSPTRAFVEAWRTGSGGTGGALLLPCDTKETVLRAACTARRDTSQPSSTSVSSPARLKEGKLSLRGKGVG